MQAKSSTYVTEKKLLRSTVRTGPFTLRTNPRHVRAWCEWSLRQFLPETEDRELWNNGGAVRTRSTHELCTASRSATDCSKTAQRPAMRPDRRVHSQTQTHTDTQRCRQTNRQTDGHATGIYQSDWPHADFKSLRNPFYTIALKLRQYKT